MCEVNGKGRNTSSAMMKFHTFLLWLTKLSSVHHSGQFGKDEEPINIYFLHMKGNLCNLLQLKEINVTASSLSLSVSQSPVVSPRPLHTPAACLPPVLTPLHSFIPTFPPAVIKGQWQIYTHSAAQPHGPLKVRSSDLEIPYRNVHACM